MDAASRKPLNAAYINLHKERRVMNRMAQAVPHMGKHAVYGTDGPARCKARHGPKDGAKRNT